VKNLSLKTLKGSSVGDGGSGLPCRIHLWALLFSAKGGNMANTEYVNTTFRGHTWAELDAAFKKVKNPDDWKAPICALVSADDLTVVCAAIEFYTATKPKVFVVDLDCEEFLVTAAGYRLGPAGDH
jgi:hypothetical protein